MLINVSLMPNNHDIAMKMKSYPWWFKEPVEKIFA